MLTKFDNGYIRQHFMEDFYMTFSTKKKPQPNNNNETHR